MNERLDASFLDDALQYASAEAKHCIVDALACHLHHTGYQLDGNMETSDVAWFARNLWLDETNGTQHQWDILGDDVKARYYTTARTAIRVLPAYQLRVAHRLIALSKVVRDIERALRVTVR